MCTHRNRWSWACTSLSVGLLLVGCPSLPPTDLPADGGSRVDGGAADAGTPFDGGSAADGGSATDGGTAADGGVDGGTPPAASWSTVVGPALPTGAYFGRISAVAGAVYVWATDNTGSNIPSSWLYRYQGGRWSLAFTAAQSWPNDVFAISANDIWVSTFYCPGGGTACGASAVGRIHHYNGTDWTLQSVPAVTGQNQFNWVRGTRDSIHAAYGAGVLLYNGVEWTQVYTAPTDNTIYSIPAVISAGEIYSTTCSGHHKWDGLNWSFVRASLSFCDVQGSWGLRDPQGTLHLYTIGNANFSNCLHVWRYAESTVSWGLVHTSCATPNCGSSGGIWGSAGDDVYVGAGYWSSCGGQPGEVFHFDGASWSKTTGISTIPNPHDISGSGRNDIWVTFTDTLLHYAP